MARKFLRPSALAACRAGIVALSVLPLLAGLAPWHHSSQAGQVGYSGNFTTVSGFELLPAAMPGSHAFRPEQVGQSTRGMVSSFQPLATDAGRLMLQQGGNAVDAAVATAFALAVVEPSMSSLGGRTEIMIRRPSGEHVAIDGGTQVPLTYDGPTDSETDTPPGYQTIAIPGTVAALAQAQQLYGSKSLAEVTAPAINYARNGFVLNSAEASRIASAANDLFPAARGYFLKPNGTPHAAGETLIQTDLAAVLTAIATDGPDAFYKGWIAQRISQDMHANGGYITPAELHNYTAKPATQVTTNYRGYTLTGIFRPASGHSTIEALNIMGLFDMSACAPNASWASITHQALLRAINDADTSPGGTDDESAAILTSNSHAQQRSQDMTDDCPRLAATPGSGSGRPQAVQDPPGTTSLATADDHGGIVALTQSIGPNMGSQVVTPGLGFLWASTMGYIDSTPGSRPRTGQTPMIVEKNRQFVLALGGAGGKKIVPAVVETLTRVIDEDLPLADAVAAPRLYSAAPTTIEIEDDAAQGVHWPDAVLSDLQDMAYTLKRKSSSSFGRVAALSYDAAKGVYIGVTDPRVNGSVAGP